jgi:hypothetical protein
MHGTLHTLDYYLYYSSHNTIKKDAIPRLTSSSKNWKFWMLLAAASSDARDFDYSTVYDTP